MKEWSRWLSSCGVAVYTLHQLAGLSPDAEVPGVIGLDMLYPSPPGLELVGTRHFDLVVVSSDVWKKAVAPLFRCPVKVVRAPRIPDVVDLPAQPSVMFANVDANDLRARYDVYMMGVARFLIRNPEAPALFVGKPGYFDMYDILKRELQRFGLRDPARVAAALQKVAVREHHADKSADVGVSVAQAHGAGDALFEFAATGRPLIAAATGCARDVSGLALLVPAPAEFYDPDLGRAHVVNPDDLCLAFEGCMLRETRQRYGRAARSAAFRSEARARAELDVLLDLATARGFLDGVE